MCWIRIATRNVSVEGTGVVNGTIIRFPIPLTFPAAFIGNPAVVTCGGQNQDNYGWSEAERVTNTGFYFSLFAPDFYTLTIVIYGYLAIGRWKA